MKNKSIAISGARSHSCRYCLKPAAEAGEGPCWGCLPSMLGGTILRVEEGCYDSIPMVLIRTWGSVQCTLGGLEDTARRRHGADG